MAVEVAVHRGLKPLRRVPHRFSRVRSQRPRDTRYANTGMVQDHWAKMNKHYCGKAASAFIQSFLKLL